MNLTKISPLQKTHPSCSLVYLIKRSRIRKATVPDLIHHLCSLNIVLTIRSLGHGYRSPPSDALLMLIHDLPLRPVPKLPPEPTLAAQRRRSDFSACRVP